MSENVVIEAYSERMVLELLRWKQSINPWSPTFDALVSLHCAWILADHARRDGRYPMAPGFDRYWVGTVTA